MSCVENTELLDGPCVVYINDSANFVALPSTPEWLIERLDIMV